MVKASKGIMEKTRQKFRRSPRQRGLSPITRSFQSFEIGERVTIVIDSSVQRGWPHHRFHGMTGTVVAAEVAPSSWTCDSADESSKLSFGLST